MAGNKHLPGIVRIQHAGGDGFNRIHHAAAAHGDAHIDSFLPAQGDGLANVAQQRVGLNAEEFDKVYAMLGEALLHTQQKLL